MKVLFMGTPDFAKCSLEALINSHHEVCGLFTRQDKPQGRKMVLTPPPCKVLAEAHGIPVYQPEKLRDGTALDIIKASEPDVIAVVAYGKIIPKDILAYPKFGCVNVHGSLLPKYRGSAPIQWSVINGEAESGVTTIFMDEGIDTGDIIFTEKTAIHPEEMCSELYERLMKLGADLLIKTLDAIDNGTAPRTPQNNDAATFAPMLTKSQGLLDITKPAQELYNLFRGLTPWPGVFWDSGSDVLKLHNITLEPASVQQNSGTLYDTNGLVCGDGAILRLHDVQPNGGKKMDFGAYLRGKRAK